MIWRIYLQRARNLNAAGDIDGSFEMLEKMLKFRPSVSAKVLYGFYLLKRGRFEKAKDVFENHIMNDKRVYKKERKNKKGKIILNKNEMTAKTNYALCLWKNGNIDDAISMLEYVHRKMHTTDLYCNLGYLYILKGDMEKALRYNRFAYDFNPDSNGICDNLGLTYYRLGKFDEAREIYEEAENHEKQAKFPEFWYNYANVLLEFDEKEKAVTLLEKALQLEFDGFTNITYEMVENLLKTLS